MLKNKQTNIYMYWKPSFKSKIDVGKLLKTFGY